MTIRVALHHKSHYVFDRPVVASPHEIRLRPAAHSRTPVSGYSLKVKPEKHFIHWQQDAYGNFVARITFPEPTQAIDVTVDLLADMTVINPFDFFVEEWAEHYPFKYPETLQVELAPFLEVEAGPLLKSWLDAFQKQVPNSITTTNFLVSLNQKLHTEISYLIRMEPGVQTGEETLQKKSGSCRDSAWLLVQMLRHLGIAARFVSGYLIQLVADEKPLDGPAGPTVDFTDLHAWCEAYIPGAGWVGLDATSGLLAGEGHIPLAVSASPASAAPVSGMTSICESQLNVEMAVTRIHEDPRVTKPYSEEQWLMIQTLGQAIDRELQDGDVRLTQGGEPTFVSVDNMDGAEWNIAALGPEKWQLANQLLRRLQTRFATGGVLHFGQGKWYPGEPLPRWALSVYWRIDGVPAWREPSLIAEEAAAIDAKALQSFAEAFATRLGLHTGYLIPAYEDPWLALDEESRLPANIDPYAVDLEKAEVRGTLAKQLRSGLASIKGYVLPLKAVAGEDADIWQSSLWPLKHQRLYLLPGDSPMGLRLPLGSLPWLPPEDFELELPLDPFAERESLADYPRGKPARQVEDVEANPSARQVIHTALALEVREGFLYAFMPPLTSLEAWLELLAALEDCAARLNQPLRLEGYPPPRDPRLLSLSVTPDPGVIEVNIHPSDSWDALEKRTQSLYEDARLTRLATEKFMLDGRHTGTGGGNHITLGGATAAESPFLRRPDLLKSLISYWQQHPALSYLFSGQFIGPTSQAPRVDEARDDNLYELEIAFQQMEEKLEIGQESAQPWLVDRLLRNLLIDLTGNTHRAEFCIDKLYSPDSATGRLGLVELRAFEMPPHYRMSLLQSLLLRALVARFWKTPHRGKLVYWDTALHDRFMLPHFIEQDMRDICRDLRGTGYAFDDNWFAPFIEFRFPHYGSVVYEGVRLELRQAIEPWHVLGEEVSGGGTARYVDSSVERLQIKVSGMIGNRHRVVCNGRIVPLHPTGVPGEFVAGVRFKAWAPPSALHPSIGVHAPLVFDLLDSWNGRSIGGCTYHVSHPGGRNYETFPVNANEAEARRRARFWEHGHSAGPMQVQEEAVNPRFPMTLDLRWQPE